ncbi:MAG: sulfotransferase family protein [Acidimicrobiales bacterium]
MHGPVFVAGLERTGTSLMYALLASHPRIAMTRRTNLWTHFYGQYGDLGDDANLERCLDTMMRYRRIVKLRPDRERLRHEFRTGERTYGRLFALLSQQHAERLGKPRWGDKSLNTERYARPIFDAYPDARILHMIRDPRDRFASSLTRWQRRRGGIGAGTAEWLASARLALRNARDHPDAYRLIRYETVVSAPEQSMRDVCDFIDEPFAPEMLSLQGAPQFSGRGSNSSYGQRAPGTITTTSVGRFRDVLSPRQVAFVQRLAGDQMAHFGYEPDPVPLPPGGWVRFAVETVPLETARLLAWRAREAVHDRKGRPVPAYRLVEGARS